MSGKRSNLLVVSSRFPYGHQETYLTTELRELAPYFERVAVAPLRSPAPPAGLQVPPGVEVLAWPLFGAEVLSRAIRVLFARPRRTLVTIVKILASRDPGKAKNLTVVVKAMALAHWTIEHRFEHIHAYWISAPATMAFIAAEISGASWSSTAHRWDIYERNAFDLKQRSAKFVRTISERGTRDLCKHMPLLADRVIQVRLGTAVPELTAIAKRPEKTLKLICPAALVAIKGHADLLDAIAGLRKKGVPVTCVFAGTGPLREFLELRVSQLALGDVVSFDGFIPQSTLHARYRSGEFAAVVLASRAEGEKTMEGVPSALIEAMAFGVPVVATDSGSIGELLNDTVGRLVPAGDANALAGALLDVYEQPDETRERARRAYSSIVKYHDVRVQMRTLAAALSGERTLQ